MVYEVLGIRIGSFNNPETGQVIKFGQLHCKFVDPEVTGESVEVVKVNPELIIKINVGDNVRFDRNSKGRVLFVEQIM